MIVCTGQLLAQVNCASSCMLVSAVKLGYVVVWMLAQVNCAM